MIKDSCQSPPVKPFQFRLKCGSEMKVDSDEMECDCPRNHGPFSETAEWAFQGTAWKELAFTYVELKDVHRQSDASSIKMLQRCRLGIPFTAEEMEILMGHPHNVDKATKLLCTRRGGRSNHITSDSFRKLKTPGQEYHALDGFQCRQAEHSFHRYTTY